MPVSGRVITELSDVLKSFCSEVTQMSSIQLIWSKPLRWPSVNSAVRLQVERVQIKGILEGKTINIFEKQYNHDLNTLKSDKR